MTWLRVSTVFVAATVLAAPSPETFLSHRWYNVEMVIFVYRNTNTEGSTQLMEPVPSFAYIPSDLILVQNTVDDFDWLNPETAKDALHPPWIQEEAKAETPSPSTANDKPQEEPIWLGSRRWSEPLSEVDLGAITGFGLPQARFLYQHLSSSAELRRTSQVSSGAAKSQTAREILDSVGSAFAGYEAELIAGVHQWNVGGNRLARTVERLERNGARVIAHGSFLQAIWPIKKSPPLLLQFGKRLSNDVFEVEGTMNLAQDRILQLDLWFLRTLEQDVQTVPASPLLEPSHFSHSELHEVRRAVGRQTHYFDHPDFGVLVHLQPLEVKEELLRLLIKIDEAVTGEFLE